MTNFAECKRWIKNQCYQDAMAIVRKLEISWYITQIGKKSSEIYKEKKIADCPVMFHEFFIQGKQV